EATALVLRPELVMKLGLRRGGEASCLQGIGALLQGSHDNYDTDLFKALIEASAHVTNVDPYGDQNVHHRVIADHLRSTSFLIADGVMPSNDGRGYVLRRIMRRAMRHAHLLGAKDPVMHQLVPSLVSQMGEAYPELRQAQPMIEETLRLEETRFKQTLDRGLKLLDGEVADLGEGDALNGATAFKLYDTYGFPLDLTQDALREKGLTVDTDGFDAAMEEQKAKARAAWAGSGEAADATVWFDVAENAGVTEFLGYDTEEAEGQVVALVQEGAEVETAAKGAKVQIAVNQTPFYAESGGQVGDTGVLKTEAGAARITDTRKARQLFASLSNRQHDFLARCREIAGSFEDSALALAAAARPIDGKAFDFAANAEAEERVQARLQEADGALAVRSKTLSDNAFQMQLAALNTIITCARGFKQAMDMIMISQQINEVISEAPVTFEKFAETMELTKTKMQAWSAREAEGGEGHDLSSMEGEDPALQQAREVLEKLLPSLENDAPQIANAITSSADAFESFVEELELLDQVEKVALAPLPLEDAIISEEFTTHLAEIHKCYTMQAERDIQDVMFSQLKGDEPEEAKEEVAAAPEPAAASDDVDDLDDIFF
ncbi:MAG: alanine--tRNA ligase-related protein, partial [Pseudomonadota bacterium]|nr:alanine--tRNA ligase-related protein [Pseudomonadota bacterium]